MYSLSTSDRSASRRPSAGLGRKYSEDLLTPASSHLRDSDSVSSSRISFAFSARRSAPTPREKNPAPPSARRSVRTTAPPAAPSPLRRLLPPTAGEHFQQALARLCLPLAHLGRVHPVAHRERAHRLGAPQPSKTTLRLNAAVNFRLLIVCLPSAESLT